MTGKISRASYSFESFDGLPQELQVPFFEQLCKLAFTGARENKVLSVQVIWIH